MNDPIYMYFIHLAIHVYFYIATMSSLNIFGMILCIISAVVHNYFYMPVCVAVTPYIHVYLAAQ